MGVKPLNCFSRGCIFFFQGPPYHDHGVWVAQSPGKKKQIMFSTVCVFLGDHIYIYIFILPLFFVLIV